MQDIFTVSYCRDVRGVRLPDPAGAEADAVHDTGVMTHMDTRYMIHDP